MLSPNGNYTYTDNAKSGDLSGYSVAYSGALTPLTGTIVATAHIHISSCAVAYGNLTINVASTQDVSQPNALSSGGTTQVTTRTDTSVTESKSSLIVLPELPTVEKVAQALNTLGATPRDMMAIFQAMKQAGALQADLVIK